MDGSNPVNHIGEHFPTSGKADGDRPTWTAVVLTIAPALTEADELTLSRQNSH
ncbi:hypothetical protein ACN4EK_21840 [Pantanalinema rosaneae CENA516]|uniref:hypothetical protein n=1 Tax=Pantanalinema rosaneae TaxID=1620701 RepID=UPI003D6EE14C